MEMISIIASVIAAIAAVATLWFSVRNSKGNLHKRILKKENKIRRIENQQIQTYGLNGRPSVITPLDVKKSKIQSQINDLKMKL